jgi:hypothetical protein
MARGQNPNIGKEQMAGQKSMVSSRWRIEPCSSAPYLELHVVDGQPFALIGMYERNEGVVPTDHHPFATLVWLRLV